MIKDGYWGGFTDYRYGTSRPVYNPAKNCRPLMSKDKRKHVLAQVTALLRTWKQSPFELEATCRHGLRQALCIEGDRWQPSDAEAASIVAEALRDVGAIRPKWEEGQRGYVEPRENCAWCADPIRPEDYGVRGRFCSPECAKLAITRMDFEDGYYNSSVGRAAYELVLRHKKETKDCRHCGKAFHPGKDTDGLFCSHHCYHVHQRPERYDKHCEWCSAPFTSYRVDARFCSRACNEVQRQVRTGKWVPKRVSPPVFDYFIAALAA